MHGEAPRKCASKAGAPSIRSDWKIFADDKSDFQGAKKIIFTVCHLGKLKLAFTSPDVISTSPKSF